MTSNGSHDDRYVAACIRTRNDEIARILAQANELNQRLLGGRLDASDVRRGLQLLIEGKPIVPVTPAPHFVSLIQQIVNVERWNAELGWGFSEELIARRVLEARTFDWPGDRLQAIVLVPSLCTPQETFANLAKVATRIYSWGSRMAEHYSEPGNVTLRDGIDFRPHSLEWRFVDLGSHVNSRQLGEPYAPSHKAWDCVTTETAAHAEVIAAAAHFPKWLESVHRKKAPNILIPGYEVVNYDKRFAGHSMMQISYGSGDIFTHLEAGIDNVWDGWGVATAGPMAMGVNVD